MISDVGRLEEGQVVEASGLGLARAVNVVSIRSAKDLEECLGPNLTGLGLDLAQNLCAVGAVKQLCRETNMSPKLVECGNLILFNLVFLTALEREDALVKQREEAEGVGG